MVSQSRFRGRKPHLSWWLLAVALLGASGPIRAQNTGTTQNVTSRSSSNFTVAIDWPTGASQALIGVGESAGTIWTPTNGQTYSTSNPGGASGVRESTYYLKRSTNLIDWSTVDALTPTEAAESFSFDFDENSLSPGAQFGVEFVPTE